MSQNKTVFPGLAQESDYNPNQSFAGENQEYARTRNKGGAKGTVYPGMGSDAENATGNQRRSNVMSASQNNGKPIVGFLYSISRTGIGEYWPLHIGQNIIGNSPECDIILGEGTVSQKHANLHINKMKKPEKTEATISDLGSTNGTLVNGNSVSVARPVECVDGDIITIGENYDLLLLLIDTKALGLQTSVNFYDVREEQEDSTDNNFSYGNETRIDQDFPPRFNGPNSPYNNENRRMDSTVGFDSNENDRRKNNGTVGLD